MAKSKKAAQDKDDEPKIGLIKRLADEITKTDHFARDAGRKLYVYSNGGFYTPYGQHYIGRLVKSLLISWELTDAWSSNLSKEVAEYILVDAPELWDKPPQNIINLKNGLYNLEEGKLNKHTPDHLSPIQIPISYDPEATCPAWEKFVSEVFPEDAQDLAWEIPAWLMTPDTSIQRSILLTGEGANGKSTYLTAVSNFIGQSNMSNMSLHKIESDRFSVARLVGKLANICSDLPSAHLSGSSNLKAITGGDRITAEYKFRNSFEFTPYSRLIFSANHPPRSEDSSHAFFRRWLVVPFLRTFEGKEEIPRDVLDACLADEKELSGVLNKALAVLPCLRKQGFTESDSMKAAWNDFRSATDPLIVWVERNTIKGADVFIVKADFYSAYVTDCEIGGRIAPTQNSFGRTITKLFPEIKEGQRTIKVKNKQGVEKSKVVWAYIGIRLKTEDEIDEEEYDSQVLTLYNR